MSLAPVSYAVIGAVLAAFIFFYPIWTAMPQSPADQQMRTLGRRRVTAFLVILDAALTLAGRGRADRADPDPPHASSSAGSSGWSSGCWSASGATYGLSLVFGLTTETVLEGPLVVLAGALGGVIVDSRSSGDLVRLVGRIPRPVGSADPLGVDAIGGRRGLSWSSPFSRIPSTRMRAASRRGTRRSGRTGLSTSRLRRASRWAATSRRSTRSSAARRCSIRSSRISTRRR